VPASLNLGSVIKIGPFELIMEKIGAITPILINDDSHHDFEREAISPDSEPYPLDIQVPGLSKESRLFMQYLPQTYDTEFMSHFLALFESILTPIAWNIDNFDLFLNPGSAPEDFLPWLASWHVITFSPDWNESQRRMFLKDAYQIYSLRGTKWSMGHILEIYTGTVPEIIEFQGSNAFEFTIKFPFPAKQVNSVLLEQIINAHKPVYTSYKLEFSPERH